MIPPAAIAPTAVVAGTTLIMLAFPVSPLIGNSLAHRDLML
jgi:hypothetical protein